MLWIRHVTPQGYGRVSFAGMNLSAHRVAYELRNGRIGEGLQIDHLCRVRRCVNPDHLEAVTADENMRRGLRGELRTQCSNGHPATPESTYTRADGVRDCRICLRARTRTQRETLSRAARGRVERQAEGPQRGPTRRQFELLRFIAERVDANDSPTIVEICAHLKISSTNGANDHLKALVRKGLIERPPRRARAFRITEVGRFFLRKGPAVPFPDRFDQLTVAIREAAAHLDSVELDAANEAEVATLRLAAPEVAS